jgi:hypothetical protein
MRRSGFGVALNTQPSALNCIDPYPADGGAEGKFGAVSVPANGLRVRNPIGSGGLIACPRLAAGDRAVSYAPFDQRLIDGPPSRAHHKINGRRASAQRSGGVLFSFTFFDATQSRSLAPRHHAGIDYNLGDVVTLRQIVHHFQHQILKN